MSFSSMRPGLAVAGLLILTTLVPSANADEAEAAADAAAQVEYLEIVSSDVEGTIATLSDAV